MKKFKIFTRTFWKENSKKNQYDELIWAGGLEPCLGKKNTIGYAKNEEEARKICKDYNESHNPGRLSRKAEYTTN